MGQSSHSGSKKGHFPFGQRLPGGELAGGAISGGDPKPGRHAGVVGGEVLWVTGFAPGILADTLGSGGARGLHIVTPEGLFTPTRVCVGNRDVLSIPSGDTALQVHYKLP